MTLAASCLVLIPSPSAQQSPTGPAPSIPVQVPPATGQLPPGTLGLQGQIGQPGAAGQPGMGEPIIDQGSRPGAPPPQGGGSAVRSVGGVSVGTRRAVATTGEQDWQPILDREVPEVELPDEGQMISINGFASPIPIIEVLEQVQVATGWNIVASPGLEELTIRFWVQDVRPNTLLKMLRTHGLYYEFDPESRLLNVMLQDEYLDREFGSLSSHDYLIQHADVIDMESILRSLMSPAGKMIPDPRTGRILVWDTIDNIDAMTAAVESLDMPLLPRVFPIKHLSADSLLESLSAVLSERGVAHADPTSNTIIVTDVPSRQEQIALMLNSLDVPLVTRTWTLAYADPESIAERLEFLLPEDSGFISTDEDTHQITVSSIPERIEEIDRLIAEFDIKQPQVEIQAFLVTANVEVMRDFGIDWSYFDDIAGAPFAIQRGGSSPNYSAPGPDLGQRVSVGRLPYRQFLRDPITQSRRIFLPDPDGNEASAGGTEFVLDPEFRGNRVAVVLDYLDQTDDVDILARPRVTVQDGEEALFQRVQQRAFQSFGFNTGGVVTGGDDQALNINRITPGQIQFIDVGIILKVLPRISEDGNILMTIEAEDSDAVDTVLQSAGLESTVPEKIESRIETEVLVQTGDTIVIGGLRANSFTDNVDKLPLLGDIPFVGKLFTRTSRDSSEREFIVFITPTIRDERSQPEAERLAELDEQAKDRMRNAQKRIWGRALSKLHKGENELAVSIGHSNDLYSDGVRLTVEGVESRFAEAAQRKLKPLVVLRVHPDASDDLVMRLTESAMVVGLEFEVEDSIPPIVPTPNWDEPFQGSAEEPEG